MILGEDWLEVVSPIWVNYKTKAIRITLKGKRVELYGIQDKTDTCTSIGPKKLLNLIQNGGVTCCLQLSQDANIALLSDECQTACAIQPADPILLPEPIQKLLHQYEHLFSTLNQLPPPRTADHKIQLIPEAQPVKIRPYHYSPI